MQFGGGPTPLGPVGGCLARIFALVFLVLMAVLIALGLVVIPIAAAVSYFIVSVWGRLTGRRDAEEPTARRVTVEQLGDARCAACGADLSPVLGQEGRGACPQCGTLFGFDVAVRHEAEAPPALPPSSPQPPPSHDRSSSR